MSSIQLLRTVLLRKACLSEMAGIYGYSHAALRWRTTTNVSGDEVTDAVRGLDVTKADLLFKTVAVSGTINHVAELCS